MTNPSILARLWDYGWICRDRVELVCATTDANLIDQYVSSQAFHTSFLPNDKDETGIHGPFVANRITATGFVPLQEGEVEEYLESIEHSAIPAEDLVERFKIATHLHGAFDGARKCYVLRRDERDSELFHEWGFVLFVFREFLFIGPDRNGLDRLVVGYD
jgi:hypothetical protein